MNDISPTDRISTDKKDYTHHAIKWEPSKLSQSVYCAKHGLDYSRLVTARSKLLGTDQIWPICFTNRHANPLPKIELN